MKKGRLLLIYFLIFYSLLGCERKINLSPKHSYFEKSKHLKKFDGSEGLPKKLTKYIFEKQQTLRNIASKGQTILPFSPNSHPKFPLPYFLIPEQLDQFFEAKTVDANIIDEIFLKISGKKHCKFLIHPANEHEFDFLRGAYTYIDVDHTEFYATPTSDPNTLIVWNKNNPKRKAFLAVLEPPSKEKNLNRQIIQDLPINIRDEKN